MFCVSHRSPQASLVGSSGSLAAQAYTTCSSPLASGALLLVHGTSNAHCPMYCGMRLQKEDNQSGS